MTTFYGVQVGRVGNAGVPDTAGPVLARLLFGHAQRAAAANVFCRLAAGWDGCCAEGGKAVVVNGAKRSDLI
jgi:hypothetical protein